MNPLLTLLTSMKSSVQDPVQGAKYMLRLRDSLETPDEKIMAELAFFCLMAESFLRPSTFTPESLSDSKTSIVLSWTAVFDTYMGFVLEASGDPSIQVQGSTLNLSWTPGELTIEDVFNFITKACIANKDALKKTSLSLLESLTPPDIESDYSPVHWISRSLLTHLPEVLDTSWFIAPCTVDSKECFVGGLYRHSMNVGLQMYSRSKNSPFLAEYYDNSFIAFCDLQAWDLFFTEPKKLNLYPVHMGPIYYCLSFICGVLHHAAVSETLSLDQSHVLNLENCIAYRKNPGLLEHYLTDGGSYIRSLWDTVDADVLETYADWCAHSGSIYSEYIDDLTWRLKFLRYLMKQTVTSFTRTSVDPTTPLQVLMSSAHAWARITEQEPTSRSLWILS